MFYLSGPDAVTYCMVGGCVSITEERCGLMVLWFITRHRGHQSSAENISAINVCDVDLIKHDTIIMCFKHHSHKTLTQSHEEMLGQRVEINDSLPISSSIIVNEIKLF